jgi:hypothetical protein
METMVPAGRVTIPLPIVFPVARDNCYCPKCGVWYNCASDAHAGH